MRPLCNHLPIGGDEPQQEGTQTDSAKGHGYTLLDNVPGEVRAAAHRRRGRGAHPGTQVLESPAERTGPAALLGGGHRDYFTKRRGMVLGGGPEDWMARCGIREAALKVGEDHESLRLECLLLDVPKAGAEAGSGTACRFERNRRHQAGLPVYSLSDHEQPAGQRDLLLSGAIKGTRNLRRSSRTWFRLSGAAFICSRLRNALHRVFHSSA